MEEKPRDSLLGKPVPNYIPNLAESTESRYEIVESIKDIGEALDGLLFRVQWEGLPDKRDWAWQAAAGLHTDIPDIVKNFFIYLQILVQLCATSLV